MCISFGSVQAGEAGLGLPPAPLPGAPGAP